MLEKILPRFRYRSLGPMSISSFRWRRAGYDLVDSKLGWRFIQYGKHPVKFILIKKRADAELPSFVSSYGWQIVWKKKKIFVGVTYNPLKTQMFWRDVDVVRAG